MLVCDDAIWCLWAGSDKVAGAAGAPCRQLPLSCTQLALQIHFSGHFFPAMLTKPQRVLVYCDVCDDKRLLVKNISFSIFVFGCDIARVCRLHMFPLYLINCLCGNGGEFFVERKCPLCWMWRKTFESAQSQNTFSPKSPWKTRAKGFPFAPQTRLPT